MSWRVLQGDCAERMCELDEASVDAICTDPPYGIGFMGKEWDGAAIAEAARRDRETRTSLGPASPSRPGRAEPRSSSAFGNEAIIAGPVRGGADFQAWCEGWAREALRVLKPGGHLLAFGGTRTYHRLACAVEDAGFEIRDCVVWLYGSGFPKSLDVAKSIDKAERGVPQGGADPTSPAAGMYRSAGTEGSRGDGDSGRGYGAGPGQFMREQAEADDRDVVPEAEAWRGWGTALKPAHEPIVVARKPLAGTVAANCLEHGTGALNVDGCRIEHDGTGSWGARNTGDTRSVYGAFADEEGLPSSTRNEAGRWPANVVLDLEAAALLDEQTGELGRSAGGRIGNAGGGFVENVPTGAFTAGDPGYGDSGGASPSSIVRRRGGGRGTLGSTTSSRSSAPTETSGPTRTTAWLVASARPGASRDPAATSIRR